MTATPAPAVRIRTVKLGPDAAGRGARIVATVHGRRRTVPYDYAAGAAGSAMIAATLAAREILGIPDPVVTELDSDPARGRLFTAAPAAAPLAAAPGLGDWSRGHWSSCGPDCDADACRTVN